MTRIPSKWFWISLLIPIVVLLSLLIKPISTTLYGEEVTLATIPIDPRDLFYGDYVILDLEIEEIESSLLEQTLFEKINDNRHYEDIPVYVSLREGESGIYQASAVSEQKPDEGLFLKGKMSPFFHKRNGDDNSTSEDYVRVEYGIERFYVEEGTGLKLEKQAQEGQVHVLVKVYQGYPVVKDVIGVQQ
jgi:uncharacterized membrane-anchored protein